MSSAIYFNLDQSKIVSSGNKLTDPPRHSPVSTSPTCFVKIYDFGLAAPVLVFEH